MASRMQGVVNMPGGVQVFGGDPQRFKQRDVGGARAAGFGADEDLSQFSLDVCVSDDAFLLRDEEVAGFVKKRLAAVCEKAGALHGFAVDFAVVGCTGADDVEVSAGF